MLEKEPSQRKKKKQRSKGSKSGKDADRLTTKGLVDDVSHGSTDRMSETPMSNWDKAMV